MPRPDIPAPMMRTSVSRLTMLTVAWESRIVREDGKMRSDSRALELRLILRARRHATELSCYAHTYIHRCTSRWSTPRMEAAGCVETKEE